MRNNTGASNKSSAMPPSQQLRQSTQDSQTTKVTIPIRRHRLRWWIASCISFLVLAPLVSIMLGLHLHARDFQYMSDPTAPKFVGRTVLMEVVLIRADPSEGVMTLDWTFLGENQSDCTANSLNACSDINLFFDNDLLRAEDPTQLRTSDPPTSPIFRINATAFATNDIVANTPTFRTELALFSISTLQSSLIYYPFDQYSAEIFMFARDAKDNTALGLSFGKTRGIAVGFKTRAVTRPRVNIPIGMIDVIITLKRGNLVKTFSVVTVLAIWLITLILLLVMLTCVFFGFRQKGEVLVIPVATLFAFTQLRQSMPGAPEGFGDILDFVGLLPCLTFLSLSPIALPTTTQAALTLGAFLLSDPTEKSQMLSWDLLFEAFPKLDPCKTRQPDEVGTGDSACKETSLHGEPHA